MRQSAILALKGVATNPQVQERLLELLLDQDWKICKTAVESLELVANEPQVWPHLLCLINPPESAWVRILFHSMVPEFAVVALERAAAEPEVWRRLLQLTSWTYGYKLRLLAARALRGARNSVTPALLRRFVRVARREHKRFQGFGDHTACETLELLLQSWEEKDKV